MKAKNSVAKTIQIYSIINAVACVFLGLFLPGFVAKLIFIAVAAVVNFSMYAFGEVIELLHQIKENTANVSGHVVDTVTVSIDELPEL